jgi:ribose transport system substrate-binding protein
MAMSASGRWIALCLHDLTNEYQRSLWDDAKKRAPRYDHTVTVYSAERNPDTQITQIRTILDLPEARRPCAILVNPVRESMLLGIAKDAVSKGIAWAYLCRWTDTINDLRRAYPRAPVFSISANQHNVGQIQGLQLKTLLRPGDELVHIQGPNGVSTTQRRFAATQEVLRDVPGLKWSIFNGDWSKEGGHEAMRGWLKIFINGVIPSFVVAAQNDDMAYGARQALFEWASAGHPLAVDQLRFLGCDGNASFGQRLVSEGELTATVAVPAVSGKAIDEIFAAIKTGRMPIAELNVDAYSYPSLEELGRVSQKRFQEKRDASAPINPKIGR